MPAELSDLLPVLLHEDPNAIATALESLAKHSITTDVDLAFVDLHGLPRTSPLPLHEALRLQQVVQRHLATNSGRRANEDLASLPHGYPGAPKAKLVPLQRSQTGLIQLDMLLSGGWEAGEIVQVSGAKKVGKTQFVLYSLLTHLLLNGSHRAVWIDTDRSFDAGRANDILQKYLIPELFKRGTVFRDERGTEETDVKRVALQVLRRLDVSTCANPTVVLDTLAAAISPPSSLSKQQEQVDVDTRDKSPDEEDNCQLSVIVIDCLTHVLLPDSVRGSAMPSLKLGVTANAAIASFMRRLKGIAQSCTPAATVFLTNDTEPVPAGAKPFSIFPTRPRLRPALGLTHTYLTDTTIWITRNEAVWVRGETNKGTIEIAASRRTERGGWIGFVSDDGIGMSELQ